MQRLHIRRCRDLGSDGTARDGDSPKAPLQQGSRPGAGQCQARSRLPAGARGGRSASAAWLLVGARKSADPGVCASGSSVGCEGHGDGSNPSLPSLPP